MKRLFILVGSACVIVLPLAVCSPTPGSEADPEPSFDQAAEEAAIIKVQEQVIAAMNNHDSKALMVSATEDVENWTGSIRGRAAFEEYHTEFWKHQTDRGCQHLDDIDIVFLTADVAIYKYRDQITGGFDDDGSPSQPRKRLVAVVFVKKMACGCGTRGSIDP